MKILILVILIIFIFYIINNYFLKKEEHYLTYFLPFYDDSKTDLENFYKYNENNNNSFKKKFNYNVLKFGTTKTDKYFIDKLINYFISTSYLINSETILYKDYIKNLSDLINNKINFSTTTYSTISYYENHLKQNINNIRLITTLYKLYIYIFTKKKYNVFQINDIKPGFIIGIVDGNSFTYYYNIFFRDLGFTENIDYIIKKYDTLNDLFKGFINSECKIIIINDIFPNNNIENFLDNLNDKDIILLPFNIPDEDLFLKKQRIINIDYIDLNLLSTSYLPKKFNDNEYTKNKPILKICYLDKILISNISTNPSYIYEFIKFYYENYKSINNNLIESGYKLQNITINNYYTSYIDYHMGVLNFFRDKGYITNNENPNCKYLVGTTECTDKSLLDNNLINKFNE